MYFDHWYTGMYSGRGSMKFVKMHGLGNDFLIFDCLENGDSEHAPVCLNAERVQKLCDRHYGIGADGVICVLPSKVADFRMLICNADGSRAQMCGNGIRCIGKYVSDHGKTEQENLRIETDAGVRQLRLDKGTDRVAVTAVRVDMGTPEFVPEHISARFSYTGVSMGNPHCVIFLNKKEELDQIPMEVYGTEMEHHPAFSNGTNVEFAWIQDAGHIFVRVWERGCGETKACGTGACAVAAAAMRMRKCAMSVVVVLPGGELRVTYGTRSRHLYLTGPAEEIFSGEVKIG